MSDRLELLMVRQEDPVGLGLLDDFTEKASSRLLTGDFEGWKVVLVAKDRGSTLSATTITESFEGEGCPFIFTRRIPFISDSQSSLFFGYCKAEGVAYKTHFVRFQSVASQIMEMAELLSVTNPLNGRWASAEEGSFVDYSLAMTSLVPDPSKQVEWCKFAKAMAIIGGE
ncbi:hypothetical protein [Pseudomonas phage vB_PaP_HN01]|nr:hypothetical protein PWJ_gp37 [Pseudomonas phage PWJ]WVH07478.1 hypothetical protein [Pseudomonas phage vB_PaP_HN01]